TRNHPTHPSPTRSARHSDAPIVTLSEITPETGTSVWAAAEGIRKRAAQERASNNLARFAMRIPPLMADNASSHLILLTPARHMGRSVLGPRRRQPNPRCAAYYQGEKDLPQTSSRLTKIRPRSGPHIPSSSPTTAERPREDSRRCEGQLRQSWRRGR